MSIQINRQYTIYFLLLLLIVSCNFSIYNFNLFPELPNQVVVGSLLDFLIVIPLLTYFFIIRKRFPIKYIGLALIAGYAAAYLIIPSAYMERYSYVGYGILLGEITFVLLELFILFKLLSKFPLIRQQYKQLSSGDSYYLFNLKRSITQTGINGRIAAIILTEISMFYYALFAWRKKTASAGNTFTYHKKTSAFAVYIMLIHATLIETIGFHFLLHNWNPIISYILLALNIYAIIYFLAEINAIRLTPFLLKEDYLLLQSGFSKSIAIPLDQLAEINDYSGPEKFTKEERKHLHDARLPDFAAEKPMLEITLIAPLQAEYMYGLKRDITRIVLNVDDKEQFKAAIAVHKPREI